MAIVLLLKVTDTQTSSPLNAKANLVQFHDRATTPVLNAHDYKELTQAIGEVSVAWDACQESLFLVFWQLTEMPERCAQAAFTCLKADSAQRDITSAIAIERYRHEHPPGEDNAEYRRIAAGIKRLGDLSGERNAATHTMWEGVTTNKLWPSPYLVRHHGKLDRVDALAQFRRLAVDLLNEQVQLGQIFIDLATRPQPFALEARPQIIQLEAGTLGVSPTSSTS